MAPHLILLPFMASGHIIPMVDIARLLARRGVTVTILTTPTNSNRFTSVLGGAININVVHLHFPSVEAGLPEGCESIDLLPSMSDYSIKFIAACDMLEGQVQSLLSRLDAFPTALISDICFPWTTALAVKLNIPRIIFHGTSCFTTLLSHMLAATKCAEAATSDFESFVVPGLPDRVELTRAQLITNTDNNNHPDWSKFFNKLREADEDAFGVVFNTFQELEPEYINGYSRVKGKKVWCVGPVSLCNTQDKDITQRGGKAVINEHDCLKWLDSHVQNSVLYVCLGSVVRLETAQMIELAVALENSGRPFVWVVKCASDGFREWLLDGAYDERNSGRGLLIHGWAPQVWILSHPSVGGFLTHCGWNSTLESIAAGVPMTTWPGFGDQFINEKLVVNVIKIGVRMGIEVPVFFGAEESVGVIVGRDKIEMAIESLMGKGDEAKARRLRAKKLGEMATSAMEKGGSSYRDLVKFIDDVTNYASNDNGSRNDS